MMIAAELLAVIGGVVLGMTLDAAHGDTHWTLVLTLLGSALVIGLPGHRLRRSAAERYHSI